MPNNNPWFWGGKSRQAFESELVKTAVLLTDGKHVKKPKVDIEAVRARKNALIKAGVLKATKNNKSDIVSIVK